MEDYSTATADGRFKVNIMLSVAENEADRTSERVRFIFESKRRKKQLAFGGKIPPFGYKVEAIDGIKRLVKDPETEPIVTDFFDHIRKYNSVRLASLFCNEKYGLTRNYRTWAGTAHRELYTGTYKGVEDYCPAYITHEEWDPEDAERGARVPVRRYAPLPGLRQNVKGHFQDLSEGQKR